MSDKIQKIGHSIIHHGKENNRIYLMKYSGLDRQNIIQKLDKLAQENCYYKIIAKVPKKVEKLFLDNDYRREAQIPDYYKGIGDCVFMCKYFDTKRKDIEIENKKKKVLKRAKSKTGEFKIPKLPNNLIIKELETEDVSNMVSLFKEVFKTYPFPIHEEEYIKKTMKENVLYFGIYKKDKLIAISSSETDTEYLNSEMTDFAILPEYRGNNYSLVLLLAMEQEMKKRNYKVLYTLARAKSYGMNITFSKLNYKYGGTLINNTNIAGNIESLNVWYKKI